MVKFTAKQQRFIELYDGNGTETARKAGYSGSESTLAVTAHNLLRNPNVLEAIQIREAKDIEPKILSRQQRQQFWTSVVLDNNLELRDRLRASELLGKSEADFTTKHEVRGMTLEELVSSSFQVDPSQTT